MWDLLLLALVMSILVYVYYQNRTNDDEEVNVPEANDDTIRQDHPVVQYPKLPFARPSVPYTADPRVINPELSKTYLQYPKPNVFGSFGVTDSVAPVWEHPPSYVDGDAPRYPVYTPKTTIPLRSSQTVYPLDVDIVQQKLGSLQGAPVDLIDANLTPPGIARPMSEWAWINYGSS